MIIKEFVELDAPESFTLMGSGIPQWFVSGIIDAPDDVYLHNNCTVHDTCGEVKNDFSPPSTGWFKTEQAAFGAAYTYYSMHGVKYPHSMSDDMLVNISKIMEFI